MILEIESAIHVKEARSFTIVHVETRPNTWPSITAMFQRIVYRGTESFAERNLPVHDFLVRNPFLLSEHDRVPLLTILSALINTSKHDRDTEPSI